tara:strand:+ start:57 stop:659 length:603 start_codon:yes stop_codon:yes gene_type:complete
MLIRRLTSIYCAFFLISPGQPLLAQSTPNQQQRPQQQEKQAPKNTRLGISLGLLSDNFGLDARYHLNANWLGGVAISTATFNIANLSGYRNQASLVANLRPEAGTFSFNAEIGLADGSISDIHSDNQQYKIKFLAIVFCIGLSNIWEMGEGAYAGAEWFNYCSGKQNLKRDISGQPGGVWTFFSRGEYYDGLKLKVGVLL